MDGFSSVFETGEDGNITPTHPCNYDLPWMMLKKTQKSRSIYFAPAKVQFDRHIKEMRGESDDEVEHMLLVVRCIGKILRSEDFFGMALSQLSKISDCCDWLRENHLFVHADQFTGL